MACDSQNSHKIDSGQHNRGAKTAFHHLHTAPSVPYAELKNKVGKGRYEARRAGQINEESKYVLEHFGIPSPAYVADVGAQVKDIEIRKTTGISSNLSLKTAWETMKAQNVVTLPITSGPNRQ